ncbi:MAG: tetratricopeptide repeat protein [Prevotella sp.]
MKLDPTGKPIRIRINVGGEEHSTLKSLIDKIKSQDFVVDELCQLWQNGSLARWLVQIGEKSTKSKLPESKHGSSPTQLEISRLLACFGIKDAQAVNKKMVEKYKKENNAVALVKALDIMARNGDNDAAFELSGYYARGEYGIQNDESMSFKYSLMAAQRGHVRAQSDVGYDYFEGFGTNKSISKALEWLEKALKKGSIEAADTLGDVYSSEEDKETFSLPKAAYYYKYAADNGYDFANLGAADCLYWLDKEEEALPYYDKAYQTNSICFDEEDIYHFADLLLRYRPKDKRGMELLKKSAEEGWSEAQALLGLYYCNGEQGLEQNQEEGVKWIRKAAHENDPLGLKLMGDCYFCGIEVHENAELAQSYYKEAALLGRTDALKEFISLVEGIIAYRPFNYLEKELRTAIKHAANNGLKEAQDFVRKYSNWLK